MKLVASYTSPYARKVRMVMAEKRIECEFVEDNIWSADPIAAQYNPLTKIPVLLLDDGTSLYDSRVIAEFLDGVTPVSRLIPESGRERALVKRWEALGDGLADAGVAVFLERKRAEAKQSEDWIARQRDKLESGIVTAARELADRKFCHGENLTLGDISLACSLAWLEFRLPEIRWRTAQPALAAWMERMETRPSFIETAPPK